MNMKFTQIGRTGGDETAPYSVTDYQAKTIVEFINEVLERRHEWGYIQVIDQPSGESNWCTRIEYRYGELLNEIPDVWQYRDIGTVKASGGWSRMDYLLTPKERKMDDNNPFKVGDKVTWYCSVYGEVNGTVTKVEGDNVYMDFDEPLCFGRIEHLHWTIFAKPSTQFVSCKGHYSDFKYIQK